MEQAGKRTNRTSDKQGQTQLQQQTLTILVQNQIPRSAHALRIDIDSSDARFITMETQVGQPLRRQCLGKKAADLFYCICLLSCILSPALVSAAPDPLTLCPASCPPNHYLHCPAASWPLSDFAASLLYLNGVCDCAPCGEGTVSLPTVDARTECMCAEGRGDFDPSTGKCKGE
jgi:hypothetical protein